MTYSWTLMKDGKLSLNICTDKFHLSAISSSLHYIRYESNSGIHVWCQQSSALHWRAIRSLSAYTTLLQPLPLLSCIGAWSLGFRTNWHCFSFASWARKEASVPSARRVLLLVLCCWSAESRKQLKAMLKGCSCPVEQSCVNSKQRCRAMVKTLIVIGKLQHWWSPWGMLNT